MFGDRLNQLDFRLAKIFRIARVRLQGQMELFNMFNGSPALLVNNNYSAGPAGWRGRPRSIRDALVSSACSCSSGVLVQRLVSPFVKVATRTTKIEKQ